MRTLAATFDSRDQAEAACRRLEAIGIARERIVVKDVAGGSAGAPPGGGVFVSLKVTNEQVHPVNGILKSQAPEPAVNAPPQAAAVPAAQAESPPRPLSSVAAEPGFGSPAGAARPQPATRSGKLTPQERARLGRNLILFCLLLVAAFMIGAWLKMLS